MESHRDTFLPKPRMLVRDQEAERLIAICSGGVSAALLATLSNPQDREAFRRQFLRLVAEMVPGAEHESGVFNYTPAFHEQDDL